MKVFRVVFAVIFAFLLGYTIGYHNGSWREIIRRAARDIDHAV